MSRKKTVAGLININWVQFFFIFVRSNLKSRFLDRLRKKGAVIKAIDLMREGRKIKTK